ncbi:MAG TPA: hypothetical protein PK079_24180 [Leptospiraceae bacterium]|nr:hypothetical protein [Leptospiraceae bacterium]HMW08620.1 hypothetical protein [Leptospiraceae bacterium]HMX34576.1 hypothetical protein [Leptospiraceae bacterium]HMY34360.1 hypothetical protein [Leptospiraceae bacterium]HMZ66670.1 hypothetical protein [Leptospiraceae bacterium]
MNRVKKIIFVLFLFTSSLFSQEVGFNDSVKLKNGKILENVKTVTIKDAIVAVDSSGVANVYSKKEVLEVVKNGKLSEVKQVSKGISSKTSSGVWTEYSGRRPWVNAVEYCESIGARLPTGEELKTAYESGLTKSWEKDGCMYWTVPPDYSKEKRSRAYTIGGICSISKEYQIYSQGYWYLIGDVRCIR